MGTVVSFHWPYMASGKETREPCPFLSPRTDIANSVVTIFTGSERHLHHWWLVFDQFDFILHVTSSVPNKHIERMWDVGTQHTQYRHRCSIIEIYSIYSKTKWWEVKVNSILHVALILFNAHIWKFLKVVSTSTR